MENKMNNINVTDADMLELAGFIDELYMGLEYNITYADDYTEGNDGENEVQHHYKARTVEWLNLPKVFSSDQLQWELEQALTTYYDKHQLFDE